LLIPYYTIKATIRRTPYLIYGVISEIQRSNSPDTDGSFFCNVVARQASFQGFKPDATVGVAAALKHMQTMTNSAAPYPDYKATPLPTNATRQFCWINLV